MDGATSQILEMLTALLESNQQITVRLDRFESTLRYLLLNSQQNHNPNAVNPSASTPFSLSPRSHSPSNFPLDLNTNGLPLLLSSAASAAVAASSTSTSTTPIITVSNSSPSTTSSSSSKNLSINIGSGAGSNLNVNSASNPNTPNATSFSTSSPRSRPTSPKASSKNSISASAPVSAVSPLPPSPNASSAIAESNSLPSLIIPTSPLPANPSLSSSPPSSSVLLKFPSISQKNIKALLPNEGNPKQLPENNEVNEREDSLQRSITTSSSGKRSKPRSGILPPNEEAAAGDLAVSARPVTAQTKKRWHQAGNVKVNIQALSKEEFARQEVIYELETTEEDYIRDIQQLKLSYFTILNEKQAITQEESATLFSNINSLTESNQVFLQTLKEKRKQSTIISNVGDLFTMLAPGFAAYEKYCGNHWKATKLLRKLLTNPEFKQLHDKIHFESPESQNQSLESYLIKPVQRICKYPLILKEILKMTKAGDLDHEKAEKAMAMVETSLKNINEAMPTSDEEQKILLLQSMIEAPEPLNLAGTNYRLLYQGTIELEEKGKLKDKHLILFIDRLFICKVVKNLFGNIRYILKQIIPTDQYLINSHPKPPILEMGKQENERVHFQLIWAGKAKFTIYVDTEEEKTNLVKLLDKATTDFCRDRRRSSGRLHDLPKNLHPNGNMVASTSPPSELAILGMGGMGLIGGNQMPLLTGTVGYHSNNQYHHSPLASIFPPKNNDPDDSPPSAVAIGTRRRSSSFGENSSIKLREVARVNTLENLKLEATAKEEANSPKKPKPKVAPKNFAQNSNSNSNPNLNLNPTPKSSNDNTTIPNPTLDNKSDNSTSPSVSTTNPKSEGNNSKVNTEIEAKIMAGREANRKKRITTLGAKSGKGLSNDFDSYYTALNYRSDDVLSIVAGIEESQLYKKPNPQITQQLKQQTQQLQIDPEPEDEEDESGIIRDSDSSDED